jgi:hypothetical protein
MIDNPMPHKVLATLPSCFWTFNERDLDGVAIVDQRAPRAW